MVCIISCSLAAWSAQWNFPRMPYWSRLNIDPYIFLSLLKMTCTLISVPSRSNATGIRVGNASSRTSFVGTGIDAKLLPFRLNNVIQGTYKEKLCAYFVSHHLLDCFQSLIEQKLWICLRLRAQTCEQSQSDDRASFIWIGILQIAKLRGFTARETVTLHGRLIAPDSCSEKGKKALIIAH